MAGVIDAEAIYSVPRDFRDRCLRDSRSLLWPEVEVWTPENLERLKMAMGRNHAVGGFLERLRHQLAKKPPAVHRLAADVLVLLHLVSNWEKPETKLSKIEAVTSWALSDTLPDL